MSGGEGINPGLAATQANIAQELMEEDLKRELERNQLATKMAMAKEAEAQEAKVRAQNAQVMMQAMLQKYEEMKNKLDGAKVALTETAIKTQEKEEIIDKIQSMKERIENYTNKKAAVNCLQDHVQMKFDQQQSGLEFLKDVKEETDKYEAVQKAEEEKAERVKQLQEMMRKKEQTLEKTSKIKVMLERQFEIGEKKIAEQNRIATAREKLLELKMKELELQKAKLARKKKEQEEKERATEDFIAMIDKQLEDMESSDRDPRQKREAISTLIEKHFNEQEKKEENIAKEQTGAIPKANKNNKSKKVKTPEPMVQKPKKTEEKSVVKEVKEVKEEEREKPKSPEPLKPKNNKKKNKNKNKSRASSVVVEEKPAPVQEKSVEPKEETKVEKVTSKPRKTAEQLKKELDQYLNKCDKEEEEKKKDNMTEEEVKNMVANVEDKCQNIRDDIADMAMSEQYLRTKQALLKAKKKEQEMQIAQKMASLREEEVIKMREKVTKMQELLASRRAELNITEEIVREKDGAKRDLDKKIEASMRRQSYVEKKIVEKKCDNDEQH